jgi:hypothetical protein
MMMMMMMMMMMVNRFCALSYIKYQSCKLTKVLFRNERVQAGRVRGSS